MRLVNEVDEMLQYISEVTILNDLSQEMQDEVLDKALGLVIKLTHKPEVSMKNIAPLIVQLQAMSASFKMQGKQLMIFDKSPENNKKKNVYLSMSEALDRVVDSLKYLVRSG